MSMPGEPMKEVTTMNIDVVDVRLDERKLPYLVSDGWLNTEGNMWESNG